MLHFVKWEIITDVSDDLSVFISTVSQSND